MFKARVTQHAHTLGSGRYLPSSTVKSRRFLLRPRFTIQTPEYSLLFFHPDLSREGRYACGAPARSQVLSLHGEGMKLVIYIDIVCQRVHYISVSSGGRFSCRIKSPQHILLNRTIVTLGITTDLKSVLTRCGSPVQWIDHILTFDEAFPSRESVSGKKNRNAESIHLGFACVDRAEKTGT